MIARVDPPDEDGSSYETEDESDLARADAIIRRLRASLEAERALSCRLGTALSGHRGALSDVHAALERLLVQLRRSLAATTEGDPARVSPCSAHPADAGMEDPE